MTNLYFGPGGLRAPSELALQCIGNFHLFTKKSRFSSDFYTFYGPQWLQKPEPTLVPGVLYFGPGGLRAPCVLACAMHSLAIVFTYFRSFFFFLRRLLLTHFGESPMCEIIFHPIFWHNYLYYKINL